MQKIPPPALIRGEKAELAAVVFVGGMEECRIKKPRQGSIKHFALSDYSQSQKEPPGCLTLTRKFELLGALMDTAEFIELEQTSPARGQILVNVAHIVHVAKHGMSEKAEITLRGAPSTILVNEDFTMLKVLLGF